MQIPEYTYTLEQCDVPAVRRAVLREYRLFRRKCLTYLHGDADTSVMNQVHRLAWYTAVYRTLNEARRIEPERAVNGAMWELLTAGYANLMTLGIRRLVDRNPSTDSVWNVTAQIERRPELLRRENFVCYDGLPYDHAAAYRRYLNTLDLSSGGHAGWVTTTGPDAWGTSDLLHQSFDALAGYPPKRKRLDKVQPDILASLRTQLADAAVVAVCTMADKQVAHAERLAENSDAVPTVTYNTAQTALEKIVRVANFLSANFFNATTYGSIVPVPQFNVLEGLDQPWVTTENLPALHEHWHATSEAMAAWAYNTEAGFLPPKPDRKPSATPESGVVLRD
jgi:hypothetical protein